MSTVEASDSAGFFVTFCRNFIHFRHTFSVSNYYRSYVLIIGEQLMKVVGAALFVTAMCAQVYASEVAKADSAPAKADNLFVQADKNRDGKLDQTEFTLFKQLQEERLILQIKQRMDKMQFSSFDKDGDNGVTQDELKAVRQEARQKMMQKLRERQLQIKPVASAS